MQKSILKKLALLLLIQASLTKIVQEGELGNSFILKPNKTYTIERQLADAIDVTQINYPLTVKPSIGVAGSCEIPVAVDDISGFGLKGASFSKILDKDIIITGERLGATVVIKIVEGEGRFNGKTYSFTPEFLTTGRDDFFCEDAIYAPKIRAVYVGCRSRSNGLIKPAVGIFELRFNDDNELSKFAEVDFEEGDGFSIHNRLKLMILEEANGQYVVLMHDHYVNDGYDHVIDPHLRPVRSQNNTLVVGNLIEFSDPKSVLTDVIDFIEFRNDILVVSTRSDVQNGNICLTLLGKCPQEEDKLRLGPFQPTGISKDGGVLILESSHLFTYEPADKVIEIRKLNHDFTNQKWIGGLYQRFNISAQEGLRVRGGLVSAVESDGDFIANFAKISGALHSHDHLLVSARLNNAELLSIGEVGIVYNQMLFKVNATAQSFYRLDQPYVSISSDLLQPDANDISIQIYDSDMTEAEAITLNFSIITVQDPFNEIASFPQQVQIEIYPGLVIEPPFNRADIQLGNQVRVSMLDPKDSQGISSLGYDFRDHSIKFVPDLPESFTPQIMNMAEGALIMKGTNTEQVNWYQCYEISQLDTECLNVGNTTALIDGFLDVAGSVLEVTYTLSYDAGKDISFFNWFQFEDDWQYEVYQGKILDVNHIEANSGVVFSVLVFSDHIKVSRFFDNWYYGNRDTVEFRHYDIGAYEFCPVQVTTDHTDRTRIYVLSSCKDEQEIFEFVYDGYAPTLRFRKSRIISTSLKAPKLCVLPSEVLIYSQISHDVYSLGLFDSYTVAHLNTGLLGINTIEDFECLPEKDLFNILTTVQAPSTSLGQQPQPPTRPVSEVHILRGGKQNNAYTRVLNKVRYENQYTRVQAFTHQKDFVLLLTQEQGDPSLTRIYVESPALVTAIADDFNQTLSLDLGIMLTNPGESSVQRNYTLVPIQVPESVVETKSTKLKFVPGKEFDISKEVQSLGSITNLTVIKSSIKRLSLGNEGQAPGSNLLAYLEKDGNMSLAVDHRQIGNFQRFQTYDVISYYTLTSPLHYGIIELMQNGKKIDSFYSINSIRSSEALEVNGNVINVFITNVGRLGDINLVWAQGGKFYQNLYKIGEALTVSKVSVFVSKEGSGTQESPIELGVIALNEAERTLYLYKVLIFADSEGRTDITVVVPIEYKQEISKYSMVERNKIVTLYYIRKDTELVEYVFINKETFEFITPPPVALSSLGEDRFRRIASVSCERYAQNGVEKCAFSTYGAFVVYIEFTYSGSDPTIGALQKYNLVRYSNFIGHNLVVQGRFVIQENDLIAEFEKKKLLVWDMDLIKVRDASEREISLVTGVVDMTLDGVETTKFSRAISCRQLEDGTVEVFIQVEDQVNDQTMLISKIITPWTIKFGGTLPWALIKDAMIGFYFDETKETLDLKISDMFEE